MKGVFIVNVEYKNYYNITFIQCNSETRELIGWFMVFNAIFNNILVISRRSVLLVKETGVPAGDNPHRIASHRQTLSHNVVSSPPRHERGSNSSSSSSL